MNFLPSNISKISVYKLYFFLKKLFIYYCNSRWWNRNSNHHTNLPYRWNTYTKCPNVLPCSFFYNYSLYHLICRGWYIYVILYSVLNVTYLDGGMVSKPHRTPYKTFKFYMCNSHFRALRNKVWAHNLPQEYTK